MPTYKAATGLKWNPNSFLPNLLSKKDETLNDGTHTPRGAKRAITLERSFDKQPWMYNRSAADSFNDKYGSSIFKDKNKSKVLKKKLR